MSDIRTDYKSIEFMADIFPSSDAESVRFLPNINHSTRQPEQSMGGTMGHDPIDQILFVNSWSPDDLKPLDWGAEFLPTTLPPN